MGRRKYELPPFLAPLASQELYERWLHRRAVAHVGRDRERGNPSATNEKYKLAIHEAVQYWGGRDFYTGELVEWSLLSSYDNIKARGGGRAYKAKFRLLPTVDHVGDGRGEPDFKVCGWRTNDAKSDLTLAEFVALCRKVVEHSDQPRVAP
jgi:hypothetical protein